MIIMEMEKDFILLYFHIDGPLFLAVDTRP